MPIADRTLDRYLSADMETLSYYGTNTIFKTGPYPKNEEESVYGAVIRAGAHVNKNAVIGDVVVEDGGKLIIKYKDGLLLDSGFSTEKGAELIIKKDRDN